MKIFFLNGILFLNLLGTGASTFADSIADGSCTKIFFSPAQISLAESIKKYLELKTEEFEYADDYNVKNGQQQKWISAETAEQMVAKYSDRYDFTGKSAEELTQVYINFLRRDYALLSDKIKVAILRVTWPEMATKLSRRDAIEFVNHLTSPANLSDRLLSPLAAREILERLPTLVTEYRNSGKPLQFSFQEPLCCPKRRGPGCRLCPHNMSLVK